MPHKFDVEPIQARWVLGLVPTEDLPQIADEALSHGLKSTFLVELAAFLPDETMARAEYARKLFERFLAEFGQKGMKKPDALKLYAKTISQSILASEETPLEGAKRIQQAIHDAKVTDCHDLDAFIQAASELENSPQDKALENVVVEEAKRWSRYRP